MATQRAVVVKEIGKIVLVDDWPKPVRKAGEVLIQQVSSSVNPVDWYVKNGSYDPKLPKCLGGDVAGTVLEADEGSPYRPGDKVFALTPWYLGTEHQVGGYCQVVSVKEEWLARVPSGLALDEAGGVPLVALTAVQALSPADGLSGARVLVTAAAGGVGHFAVQLAKAAGHYVVGTAGPANQEFIKQELGADEVLDYRKQDVETEYKDNKFDIVVDCVGGADNMKKLFAVVKPGGTYSHIFNRHTDNDVLGELQKASDHVATHTTLVQANGAQLQKVADLMAAGKVKQIVAAKFPLEQVEEAHKLSEGGRTRGKIVLTVS